MSTPVLEGITARTVTTPRLSTRVLFSGPDDGIPDDRRIGGHRHPCIA